MIAIVDYGMGNTFSVLHALEYIGTNAVVTSNHKEIIKADRIILPGVGAFGNCMMNLSDSGILEVLNEAVIEKKVPFLGICLGMQVLAKTGFEKGTFPGLGWIEGTVERLEPEDTSLKVPHVGWNDIYIRKETTLFEGLKKDTAFYFVHSYAFRPADKGTIVAECNYGGFFAAALIKDNIFATQFHPEKSQKNGLIVLENFVNWRP